jgi:hypothetical protein
MTVRDRAVQAFAAPAAAIAAGHVGGGTGLVDEDQTPGAHGVLLGAPVGPLLGDVRPVLLLCPPRLLLSVSPSRASVFVHQAETGRDLMRGGEPSPQLLERDVRPARHLGRNRGMMVLELERLAVALRPGLGLAGRRAPGQGLVDVGDADLEHLRHGLGRAATVDRCQHTAPQIGRIALPRLPRHRTTSARCNREA